MSPAKHRASDVPTHCLCRCVRVGDAGFISLAGSPALSRLTSLRCGDLPRVSGGAMQAVLTRWVAERAAAASGCPYRRLCDDGQAALSLAVSNCDAFTDAVVTSVVYGSQGVDVGDRYTQPQFGAYIDASIWRHSCQD